MTTRPHTPDLPLITRGGHACRSTGNDAAPDTRNHPREADCRKDTERE